MIIDPNNFPVAIKKIAMIWKKKNFFSEYNKLIAISFVQEIDDNGILKLFSSCMLKNSSLLIKTDEELCILCIFLFLILLVLVCVFFWIDHRWLWNVVAFAVWTNHIPPYKYKLDELYLTHWLNRHPSLSKILLNIVYYKVFRLYLYVC